MPFGYPGLAALAAASLLPFGAGAEEGIEGRRAAETIFASIGSAARDWISMGDLEVFRDAVFAGMDHEGDSRVTYAEFADWDPGFRVVAEEVGRIEAYTTASKIVFAFWDRNGDGALTGKEMRQAMVSDFRRADLDDDARLTEPEFIGGFPVIVAMRAAIRPDL